MNFLKHIVLWVGLPACLALTSCDKSDEPVIQTNRTVLVYMAANNSLGLQNCDGKDLVEMQEAAAAGALDGGGRLMIFHAPVGGSQTLMELKSDGRLDTVKVYDGNSYVVSADFMLTVFHDAKTYAPADDYGLILWSHALGWTQDGIQEDPDALKPKTWGEDRGKTMNITTLSRVLQTSRWNWVYFDCCFMGSVEVAYELAPAVDVIVASATEVPLDGMPYDKNLPLFFSREVDLIAAAENTFLYYDALGGSARTCSVSVLNLREMGNLATATVPVYQYSKIVGPNDFANLPLETGYSPRFYDFGVYVKGLCRVNDIPSEVYDAWQSAHDRVVVWHKATPQLWNTIDLADFTGLSTFIPRSENQTTYRSYDTLSWYKDVAWRLYDKVD